MCFRLQGTQAIGLIVFICVAFVISCSKSCNPEAILMPNGVLISRDENTGEWMLLNSPFLSIEMIGTYRDYVIVFQSELPSKYSHGIIDLKNERFILAEKTDAIIGYIGLDVVDLEMGTSKNSPYKAVSMVDWR